MADRQQADGLVGTNVKQTKLVRLCSSLVETKDNIDIESESDTDDIVMGLMTGPSWRDDSDDDMKSRSDADVAMDISDTEEVGERWWRYV